MKFLKTITLVLGLTMLVPLGAYASPDDLDGVTIEPIELNDSSSDAVTHEVEIPHEQEMEAHHGDHHDANEREDEREESHAEDSRNEVEDSNDDHSEDRDSK